MIDRIIPEQPLSSLEQTAKQFPNAVTETSSATFNRNYHKCECGVAISSYTTECSICATISFSKDK